MKRIIKNPEVRKKEIITASEKLFLEKGYSETTIEDILKSTNLSKGGFYHYYSSKEEVLSAIVSELVDEIIKETQFITDSSEYNAIQKLKFFFKKQLSLKKPKLLLTKYFANEKQNDFLIYKYNSLIWQKYVAPLSKIVKQGVDEGFFDLQYPYETVDILIRTISSLGDLENELLQNKDKFIRYVYSLKNITAKTLGISMNEIEMIDEEMIDNLFKEGI
ncbi:TetR/AcrR family transcriptional regulator [Enterococcus casseliflavus]|uniref:TetR/AcrR family transcriptional regulator n=1 Tax=Enterococcus casseliflavus TaxID=37734 RepID=UPI000E4878AA|nr:TetR/AcrR family transcriptional regulator [Enterococcus casseliflavus]RHH53649.1 TetR/AcrR family transcriptional regulator [Enterococcus casseliflavus]